MLRSDNPKLRVEEVPAGGMAVGRSLADFDLARCTSSLLMAVKREGGWQFNPRMDYVVRHGDTLVFMTSPEDIERLRDCLAGSSPPTGPSAVAGG